MSEQPHEHQQRSAQHGRRAWRAARTTLLVIVVVLVALPGLVYKFPRLVGEDEAYIVLSGSMVPAFHPGDVVFVDHVDPATLRAGDVITFHPTPTSKELVTHRIVDVRDESGTLRFVTKGDANDGNDPVPARASQIVGKYDFRLPYWGLLSTVLKTPIGYFVLILVPGIAIILTELVKLYRVMDKADREKKARRERVDFEVLGEVAP